MSISDPELRDRVQRAVEDLVCYIRLRRRDMRQAGVEPADIDAAMREIEERYLVPIFDLASDEACVDEHCVEDSLAKALSLLPSEN